MIAVGVKADQRVDRPATSNGEDRGSLDIAEHLGQHAGRLLVFIADWKIKRAAEYKPMPLIIRRQGTLGSEHVRVLRLFVEVRRVVNSLRKSVAAGEFDFVCESPV